MPTPTFTTNTLNKLLSPEYLRVLKTAGELSASQNVDLFLVGGSVRDILLGYRPVDLDLTAVGFSTKFTNNLADYLGGEVLSFSQFNTAKIKLPNLTIDLAMSRKESYDNPGDLPLVYPGSIDDDMKRRDFSINAMAIHLAPNSWGKLLDPYNGQRDLDHSIIRILHEKSFRDDATRILRSVRYAKRLAFNIDKSTQQAICDNLHFLDTIKGDRIRHEFERIIIENKASSILKLAQNLGILSNICPTINLHDKLLNKLEDLYFPNQEKKILIFISAMAYTIESKYLNSFKSKLNMDAKWSNIVTNVEHVKKSLVNLRKPILLASEIYHILNESDIAAIEGSCLATDEPIVSERLVRYLDDLRHVQIELNGQDLICLGVDKGPRVGEILNAILTAKLDDIIVTRDDEEKLARTLV